MSKDLTVDQLIELQKKLAKHSANNDTEAILALLASLEKGLLNPTEAIIRSSKIGVAVGKLRSHSDKAIADQAKALVSNWKAAVKQRKTKEEGNGKDSATRESSALTNPAKKDDGEKASPTPTPSANPVNVDFEVLNDRVRNACLKLLHQSLEVGNLDTQKVYSAALEIEAAILEQYGKGTTNTEYRNKVRSLSLNFKDKNNPNLRKRVVEGEIAPSLLVKMSNEELASDQRKREIEELQMQNLFKAKGAAAQQAETDAFQCGRCKQRKTRYYQMQTRSADEPMTTFVECIPCGNRWKFS